MSEFEFQSCYYIHFRTNTIEKGINPLIPASYGLNSTTATRMALALNNSQKFDMPLNKEIKPN